MLSSLILRSRVTRTLLLGLFLTSPAGGQTIPPLDPEELIVSTPAGGIKNRARTAMIDTEGSFVVVWYAPDPSASAQRVYLQRFEADGSPSGGRELVSAAQANERNADVASDLAGNFAVVWTVVTDRPIAIKARVYRADGTDSGEIDVASIILPFDGASDVVPRISADLVGNFTMVWSEVQVQDSPPECSECPMGRGLGARLDFNLQVTPFAIIEPSTTVLWQELPSFLSNPDVAVNPVTGEFFVTWLDDTDCNALPWPEGGVPTEDLVGQTRICGQRFDNQANPLGDAFKVGDRDTMGHNPSIDTNLAGNVVVAWGDGDDVRAKRYGPAGGAINGEFKVNTDADAGAIRPAVSSHDNSGHFVIVWEDDTNNTIRARWLADNFQEEGASRVRDFVVNTTTTGSNRAYPALAGALGGNFHIAWEGTDINGEDSILARRYQPPVEIQVNDISVTEGDPQRSLAAFTIQTSKPHPDSAEITVAYSTLDDSATFLDDYESVSGTVSFSGTTQVQSILVPILEDDVFEPDEAFFFNLVEPTNAVVTLGHGTGTILNDDPPGSLSIDTPPAVVEGAEGDVTTLVLTVNLEPPQELEAAVSFATGGDSDSATPGQDYQSVIGVLTLPPFFSTGEIAIEIYGDDVFEGDETFTLRLFDPNNASVGPQGVVTITLTEDDSNACQNLAISDPPADPLPVAGGSGQIDVTAEAGCDWATTVIYSADGPADWITIDAGATGSGNGSVAFTVDANADINPRSAEIEVETASYTVTQEGTVCDFTVTPERVTLQAAGGSGVLNIGASLEACQWTAIPSDEASWVVLADSPNCPAGSNEDCEQGGTGSGTVSYTVAANTDPPRNGNVIVGAHPVTFEQDGRFLDHFDDDTLPVGWQLVGSHWSETDSRLIADANGDAMLARAVARPAFGGCVQCSFEATLRFDIFSTGTLTLYGWYLDEDHHLALIADEFANRWTLIQRFAGSEVLELVDSSRPLVPDRDYVVGMSYDGTTVQVTIDGVLIFDTPPASGTFLDGTLAVQAEATTASFDVVSALTVTRGNLPGSMTITRPLAGAHLPLGQPVELAAVATDPEDGDLSAAIRWVSDVDGDLGTGGQLTVELSAGAHTLRAEVRDSGLLPFGSTVEVEVVVAEIFANGFESGDLSGWTSSNP